jgi:hypothetical protein
MRNAEIATQQSKHRYINAALATQQSNLAIAMQISQ